MLRPVIAMLPSMAPCRVDMTVKLANEAVEPAAVDSMRKGLAEYSVAAVLTTSWESALAFNCNYNNNVQGSVQSRRCLPLLHDCASTLAEMLCNSWDASQSPMLSVAVCSKRLVAVHSNMSSSSGGPRYTEPVYGDRPMLDQKAASLRLIKLYIGEFSSTRLLRLSPKMHASADLIAMYRAVPNMNDGFTTVCARIASCCRP